LGFAQTNPNPGPIRKSSSLENLTANASEGSEETAPLPKPTPTRTAGLTREHSLNQQSRMRPPANSLATRPNVPHFSQPIASEKERVPTSPRSGPLQGHSLSQGNSPNSSVHGQSNPVLGSSNRLNVETLNMKRLKSHQRHTSCPVDLGNYKGSSFISVFLWVFFFFFFCLF
jgi:hypothetical protein